MTTSLPRWKGRASCPHCHEIDRPYRSGGFFPPRFEIATAVAGSVLGINPFNQPCVEEVPTQDPGSDRASKNLARCLRTTVVSTRRPDIYTDYKMPRALRAVPMVSAPAQRPIWPLSGADE